MTWRTACPWWQALTTWLALLAGGATYQAFLAPVPDYLQAAGDAYSQGVALLCAWLLWGRA